MDGRSNPAIASVFSAKLRFLSLAERILITLIPNEVGFANAFDEQVYNVYGFFAYRGDGEDLRGRPSSPPRCGCEPRGRLRATQANRS